MIIIDCPENTLSDAQKRNIVQAIDSIIAAIERIPNARLSYSNCLLEDAESHTLAVISDPGCSDETG